MTEYREFPDGYLFKSELLEEREWSSAWIEKFFPIPHAVFIDKQRYSLYQYAEIIRAEATAEFARCFVNRERRREFYEKRKRKGQTVLVRRKTIIEFIKRQPPIPVAGRGLSEAEIRQNFSVGWGLDMRRYLNHQFMEEAIMHLTPYDETKRHYAALPHVPVADHNRAALARYATLLALIDAFPFIADQCVSEITKTGYLRL